MQWGATSISANTAVPLTKSIFVKSSFNNVEQETEELQHKFIGDVEAKMMFMKFKKDFNKEYSLEEEE